MSIYLRPRSSVTCWLDWLARLPRNSDTWKTVNFLTQVDRRPSTKDDLWRLARHSQRRHIILEDQSVRTTTSIEAFDRANFINDVLLLSLVYELLWNVDERLHALTTRLGDNWILRQRSRLGVRFDYETNSRAYIATTTKICFFHLRRLRQIRLMLGCHLCYLSSCHYSPNYRSPVSHHCSGYRTPSLALSVILAHETTSPKHWSTPHWLSVAARTEFKHCVLCIPSYAQQRTGYAATCRYAPTAISLRSATSCTLVEECTDLPPSTRTNFGTPCQLTSEHHLLYQLSKRN